MRAKRNVSQTFRRQIKEKCGDVCVGCGSNENIEYHHIVPISLGGADDFSNIVPLCHACHKAAHNGRHMIEYMGGKAGGRKPNKSDDEAFKVFDMYVHGEIGAKKAKELLGYSPRTQIKDRAQFQKYMQENGIKWLRNNVDIVATSMPQALVEGRTVGKIVYENGKEEAVKYHDTGMNDVEYTLRKGAIQPHCTEKKTELHKENEGVTSVDKTTPNKSAIPQKEAARLLGVTPSKLCYLRRMGAVTGYRVGRCSYVYSMDEIKRARKVICAGTNMKKEGDP